MGLEPTLEITPYDDLPLPEQLERCREIIWHLYDRINKVEWAYRTLQGHIHHPITGDIFVPPDYGTNEANDEWLTQRIGTE